MTYPQPGSAGQPGGDLEALGISGLVEIGRGATSTVYSARQERYARDVAVKVFTTPLLDDKARRRFERECRTLGRLSTHPNVVNLLGSGFDTTGRPFIVMDLCGGGSLQQVIARSGPMSVEEVIRTGIRVSSALAYAHANGVLHRDIKPANILFTDFGEPALSDFGISEHAQDEISWTIGESLTPLYAAPEVLEDGGGSPRSDLWSLAATLYALLLGEAPFANTAGGLVALINRITHEPPRPLTRTDVPPELIDLLATGMQKAAIQRPSGAAEFAFALQNVQRNLGWPVTEYVDVRPAAPSLPVPAPEPEAAVETDGPWDAGLTYTRDELELPGPYTTLVPSDLPDLDEGEAPVEEMMEDPFTTIHRPAGGSPPTAPDDPTRDEPRTRPRWPFIVAAAVVVLIGGGIAAALLPSSHPPKAPASKTVALTTPAVQVACHGFTCQISADKLVAGESMQIAYGDGRTSDYTGEQLTHDYATAGTYSLTARSLKDGVSGNLTTSSIVVHEWRRTALIKAAGPTSKQLEVDVRSPVSRCLPSRVRLERHISGAWSAVGQPISTPSDGFQPGNATHLSYVYATFHVSAAGTYRARVDSSDVAGGKCGPATSADWIVHTPSTGGSSSVTSGSTASNTSTNPKTTTQDTPSSHVPVEPTFAPPPDDSR